MSPGLFCPDVFWSCLGWFGLIADSWRNAWIMRRLAGSIRCAHNEPCDDPSLTMFKYAANLVSWCGFQNRTRRQVFRTPVAARAICKPVNNADTFMVNEFGAIKSAFRETQFPETFTFKADVFAVPVAFSRGLSGSHFHVLMGLGDRGADEQFGARSAYSRYKRLH